MSGMAGIDPTLMGRAESEADKLREELEKEVRADVEDAGTLRKRMTVTVPEKVIENQLKQNFEEIRNDAVIPGFRKGRAPLSLVEKRFSSDIRQSLKTSIVGQSFYAAVEKNDLEVLGDPLFEVETENGKKLADFNEALPELALPDSGDFTFTCELEIKPEFELPNLQGIPVKMPRFEITDEQVTEQIDRQRKIRGRYEPSTEAAAEADDLVIADVKLTVDGQEVKTEENVQLGVRPTRLDGIQLPTLGEELKGAKPGEARTVPGEIPDDYERPDLRGKQGQFTITIHEIKKLAPVPMETFVEQMGAESEADLRSIVREQMEREKDRMMARAQKEQVYDYLLENTKLDIPEGLSARQTDRVVMRQVVELQQNGTPESEIEARIDELRTSARDQVARDLRLEFIMEKVAEQLDMGVTDEEVNTEVARIARMYNQRFDRVRDNLQNRGLLPQLAEQIRQEKCVQRLLEDAEKSEVAPEESEGRKKSGGKKSAGKKSGGKKSGGQGKTAQKSKKTTKKK